MCAKHFWPAPWFKSAIWCMQSMQFTCAYPWFCLRMRDILTTYEAPPPNKINSQNDAVCKHHGCVNKLWSVVSLYRWYWPASVPLETLTVVRASISRYRPSDLVQVLNISSCPLLRWLMWMEVRLKMSTQTTVQPFKGAHIKFLQRAET